MNIKINPKWYIFKDENATHRNYNLIKDKNKNSNHILNFEFQNIEQRFETLNGFLDQHIGLRFIESYYFTYSFYNKLPNQQVNNFIGTEQTMQKIVEEFELVKHRIEKYDKFEENNAQNHNKFLSEDQKLKEFLRFIGEYENGIKINIFDNFGKLFNDEIMNNPLFQPNDKIVKKFIQLVEAYGDKIGVFVILTKDKAVEKDQFSLL